MSRTGRTKVAQRKAAASFQDWLRRERQRRERARQQRVTLTLTRWDLEVLHDAVEVADCEGQLEPADRDRLLALLSDASADQISDTPERILLDLIAELRDENEWHFTAMANRAEARLRKATGDE
jgi:hypothetical protein